MSEGTSNQYALKAIRPSMKAAVTPNQKQDLSMTRFRVSRLPMNATAKPNAQHAKTTICPTSAPDRSSATTTVSPRSQTPTCLYRLMQHSAVEQAKLLQQCCTGPPVDPLQRKPRIATKQDLKQTDDHPRHTTNHSGNIPPKSLSIYPV